MYRKVILSTHLPRTLSKNCHPLDICYRPAKTSSSIPITVCYCLEIHMSIRYNYTGLKMNEMSHSILVHVMQISTITYAKHAHSYTHTVT